MAANQGYVHRRLLVTEEGVSVGGWSRDADQGLRDRTMEDRGVELRLASVMTGSVHDDEDGGSRFLRLYLKLHDFPGLSPLTRLDRIAPI